MKKKLRFGMIGGGRGAFIGSVHRMAASLDGTAELICGALSADPAKARASAADWFLPPDRSYGSYSEMFLRESRLPPSRRMDFVIIVTPNHVHAPATLAALAAGFPVACDKPLCLSLAEGKKMDQAIRRHRLPFLLTHNYSGYPMVKQARAMVRAGQLGRLRKIVVEYPQGWLATRLETTGQKQAGWRTDPKRAGAAGCMGDIGTHAHHLAEYVSGRILHEVCADLTTFVRGRKLDDDGNVLLRFDQGVTGVLHASQISVDEENGLSLRIYGEKGGLEWRQEEPNTLIWKRLGATRQILRAGGNYGHLDPETRAACRLPAGHPEGYLEAFANLYVAFGRDLRALQEGRQPTRDYPGIREGLRGMAFLEAVVRSSRAGGRWTKIPV
jgi:predicted dehydrogenase